MTHSIGIFNKCITIDFFLDRKIIGKNMALLGIDSFKLIELLK